MSKKPRFYCDNCGYEVGSDVKSCPYCGRYFASIRCPRCDYSGPDKMFLNGCPLCGYSAPPSSPSKPVRVKPVKVKRPHAAEPLPAWTYIASIIFLLALIAFFSYFITR